MNRDVRLVMSVQSRLQLEFIRCCSHTKELWPMSRLAETTVIQNPPTLLLLLHQILIDDLQMTNAADTLTRIITQYDGKLAQCILDIQRHAQQELLDIEAAIGKRAVFSSDAVVVVSDDEKHKMRTANANYQVARALSIAVCDVTAGNHRVGLRGEIGSINRRSQDRSAHSSNPITTVKKPSGEFVG